MCYESIFQLEDQAGIWQQLDEVWVRVVHLHGHEVSVDIGLDVAIEHLVDFVAERSPNREMRTHHNQVQDAQVPVALDTHEVEHEHPQGVLAHLPLVSKPPLLLVLVLAHDDDLLLWPQDHESLKELVVVNDVGVRSMGGHVLEEHPGEEIVFDSEHLWKVSLQRLKSDELLLLSVFLRDYVLALVHVHISERVKERVDVDQEVFVNLIL